MLREEKVIWCGKLARLFFVNWLTHGVVLCRFYLWQLGKVKNRKSIKQKWDKKIVTFRFLILFIASNLLVFPSQSLSAEINIQSDYEKIAVTISNFSPLLDQYGKPSVNSDGTFYPNDKFTITYNVDVAESVDFKSVEAVYDQSVFNLFNISNWGSKTGSGSFVVKPSATSSAYDFSIKAWGCTLFNLGSESGGSVNVTCGGVDVEAYYTTQYLLSITASSPSEGTTNLPPGQYWIDSGESVTVTALPKSGYLFSHWLLDEYNTITNPTITIAMNSYHTLHACFKQENNPTSNNIPYTNTTTFEKTEQSIMQAAQTNPSLEDAASQVRFIAHGLGIDTINPILRVDETDLDVSQLPAIFTWDVGSAHTYRWLETVFSSKVGQRYVLAKVMVMEKYLSKATIPIRVVKYDPHFTLTLAYTVPNSNGNSSYEKPFALILRYDGNGPDYSLKQRAIIEGYNWTAYAQRMQGLENIQHFFTPNASSRIADFFSQTSNAHFSVHGTDYKTNQPVLTVDGQTYTVDELPKVFNWKASSKHTYAWTQQLPITGTKNTNTLPANAESFYEWLEWQFSLTFPPDTNESSLTWANQAWNQTELQTQLAKQLNSPNGTLTVTLFGSTHLAFYAHNKFVEKIAQETNINPKQTLQCLASFPLYFDNESRYAKTQFLLDPTVAQQTLAQNFTTAIYYNLTFINNMFGKTTASLANFTCPSEFYTKQINLTATKWDPKNEKWQTDSTVKITATFDSAFNFTETDILHSIFENQTSDQNAQKLATSDIYDSLQQTFTGRGTIKDTMNKTSPLYYNLNITAQQNKTTTTIQRTIQLNFKNNNSYQVFINLDSTSPLQAQITKDSNQAFKLALNAPPELGGLTNISIYIITHAPVGYTLNEIPVTQTNLKLLKTEHLALSQVESTVLPNYQNNYQLYQYYEGYSPIYENTLGFTGQTQISITKNPNMKLLPEYNMTLVYVEAQNIWGTKFHTILPVQPFSLPQTTILLNELTMYLLIFIAITITLSLAAFLIKGH